MTGPPLARYDFLPWLRRGVAAEITAADALTGPLPRRAAIPVAVTVESSGGDAPTQDTVTTTVELYGPGDVVGIDPRHVICTVPPNRTQSFEPNYLAAIEFDGPDFPWLFTPAAPTPASSSTPHRLRPWVSLVVLAEGEFTRAPRAPNPLPAIVVAEATTLPDLDESWAWAHAQIAGGLAAADLETVAAAAPERVSSRLLCARRLVPNTQYTAFLVPAFDVGVAAGLGLPAPSTTQASPAWNSTQTNVMLPVYYSFEFRTGPLGDFESLVRKLQPRRLPAEVGIRPMAVDAPGWGMPDADGPLGLSGALRSPETTDTTWSGAKRDAFQQRLEPSLNAGIVTDGADDPVVTPPMYGRWHAAATAVDRTQPGWVNDLNLDPRPRAMAGAGTRVVLAQRDPLLAGAWRQVEGIEEANRLLRNAQLARAAAAGVYVKHLVGAPPEAQLLLTAALHLRLRASPATVRATIARSRLPAHALAPAFRRLTRPLGTPARRRGPRTRDLASILRRLNSGDIERSPAPGRVVGLEDVADSFYPAGVPRWLRPALRWRHAVWLLLTLAVVVSLGGLWVAPRTALAAALALAVLALLVHRFARGWGAADALRFDQLTPRAFADAPPRPGFRVGDADESAPPASVGGGSVDSPEAARFREASMQLARALQAPQPEPPSLEPIDAPVLARSVVARLNPEATIPARVASRFARQLPTRAPSGDAGRFASRAGGAVLVGGGFATAGDTAGAGGTGSAAPAETADVLDPIMAAPEFPQPMYEPLRDLSQDLLLPGLDRVPPDTVALLVENHAFIEAYMVGLNHEMARQLLVDRYPTDQRGSYFRQFWDVRGYVPTPSDPANPDALRERLKDIPPVHEWPRSLGLGGNRNRASGQDGNLVLLVRGQLLARYPNAIIYAAEAELHNGRRVPGQRELHPIFTGKLPPDVTLLGFDLIENDARGSHEAGQPQGWFFVFQEQPSEPHFGLEPVPDPYAVPAVSQWNQLSWANFAATAADLEQLAFLSATAPPTNVAIAEVPSENPGDSLNSWGRDAAQTAFICLMRPARVAIHAELMLP